MISHIESVEVSYQDNGVPVLNKGQIETIALNCISQLYNTVTLSPQMIPIKALLEHLHTSSGLTWQIIPLNFDTQETILGLCDIQNYCIYIEKDLENSPSLLLFTLAHELGHFILHRHRKIKLEKQHKLFTDTHNQLKEHHKLTRPIDWLEWQANYFAASLLMPKQAFTNAIQLYLDNAKISLNEVKTTPHFSQLITNLQSMFGTSKTSLEIRFNELFQDIQSMDSHNDPQSLYETNIDMESTSFL